MTPGVTTLYYIRCTDQLASDGSVLWWRQARAGYTADLTHAGLYDEANARSIERLRGTDQAVPREIAEQCATSIRLVGPARLREALSRDEAFR